MRIFLYGISALSYWLSAPARCSRDSAVGSSALASCSPTRQSVDYLVSVFPQIPLPVHAMVPQSVKSPIPEARTHLSLFEFREKPFLRIGNGIFAPCPELCFVQMALAVPFHELLKVGAALCGRFFIDPASSHGLVSRKPLTSVKRIEAFVRRNPGLRGVKAARKALPHLAENAASPPEAYLWTLLSLPQRYGGYGIPDLELNYRIRPGKKARALARRETLVPDIVHRGGRLSIEYDSNSEHLTPEQIARDASKRLGLEAEGFKVITVTTRQLSDDGAIRGVAEQSCRRIGRRFQVQGKNFAAQHRRLTATGWSLRSYHRREWLG